MMKQQQQQTPSEVEPRTGEGGTPNGVEFVEMKERQPAGGETVLIMSDKPRPSCLDPERAEPSEKEEGCVAFAGMGKEELMKFATDPFWVHLRWFLFILFWLAWIAMLAGAIVIIILAPRCAPIPTLDWWQKNVIYQIYPRSFQDSNGDGIGDLRGVGEKLDYLKELGVGTVWMGPFYKSPMKDFGYDVEDFKSIDSQFGTLEDFELLVQNMTDKDIKLVIDFIPNHTSNTSEWFQLSRKKDSVYKNYYIWAKGKGDGPPNNWLSVFGGSAWTFDSERQEYYLHQFLPEQPDLNLRDTNLRRDLKEVLKFWLEKGVSGFRVDAVSHLFEDEDLRDEPATSNQSSSGNPYDALDHKYTKGQPEILELLAEWREVLDTHATENQREHMLLLAEAYEPMNDIMKFYGNSTDHKLADFPFNFELVTKLTPGINASTVLSLVKGWLNAMPSYAWPNWVLGNHDVKRVADRTHPELVDGLHMVTMLLRGTPVTYYGEELGMRNIHLNPSQMQDPVGMLLGESFSRDGSRSPMQWDNSLHAGFTTGDPWLPVNPNYNTTNVMTEKKNVRSHLNVYKKLVKLREEPASKLGSVAFFDAGEGVFAFGRVKRGSPGYAVLVNFGDTTVNVNLNSVEEVIPFKAPGDDSLSEAKYKFSDDGSVEVGSRNIADSSLLYATEGKRIKLNNLPLGPYQGVVIKFVPTFL